MNRTRHDQTSGRRKRPLAATIVAGLALMTLLAGAGRAQEIPAETDTLVVVNGEAITAADLDAQILKAHGAGGMADMNAGRLYRLFQRSINDRMMIQEAEAIGMGEERSVSIPLIEWRQQQARSAFLRDDFVPDLEVPESEIKAYFERYYWKVQLRQISVRTEQRADSVRTAIVGGADMAALAAEMSLDPQRIRDGAHRLKYWADVEVPIRDAARDLKIDELSRPFKYRESYSVVRVEERQDLDWDALPRFEPDIRAYLAGQKREEASRLYVEELAATRPVAYDEAIIAEISADSALVIKGEFLEGSERPVVRCGEFARDEFQVRKAISHAAMNDGLAAFATVRRRALEALREELVVLAAAGEAGYLDDPKLEAAYQQRRDQAMLEAYLAEFIAADIVFNREEFEEFYEEYRDEFRGPDQVKLDTIVFGQQQTANAIVFRLREGADFSFVVERYGDDPHVSVSRGSWANGGSFSVPIQDQLAVMEVGDTSDPVEIPSGWLVFQLAGRRPGDVLPIEAVDTEIRRVMYQKKFNELLDAHLKLLEERSEIVRNDEAITRYFGEGF